MFDMEAPGVLYGLRRHLLGLESEIVGVKMENGGCWAAPIVGWTKFQGYFQKALKGITEQPLSGQAVLSAKEPPNSTQGTVLFKFEEVAN